MAGTYTQLQIQAVIVVKRRENLIPENKLEELFEYIAGIIRSKGQKPLIVNGTSNHLHIFFGMKPNAVISDLLRDIKNNSSNFINKQRWTQKKFNWQPGYAAFSYSQSQIERVYNYIKNQRAHHKKKTFKEEYVSFLERFEINYDNKYLFDWIE